MIEPKRGLNQREDQTLSNLPARHLFARARRHLAAPPCPAPARAPAGGRPPPSRRQGCHFTDVLSPSLLKPLPKAEGGCSRTAVSPVAKMMAADGT